MDYTTNTNPNWTAGTPPSNNPGAIAAYDQAGGNGFSAWNTAPPPSNNPGAIAAYEQAGYQYNDPQSQQWAAGPGSGLMDLAGAGGVSTPFGNYTNSGSAWTPAPTGNGTVTSQPSYTSNTGAGPSAMAAAMGNAPQTPPPPTAPATNIGYGGAQTQGGPWSQYRSQEMQNPAVQQAFQAFQSAMQGYQQQNPFQGQGNNQPGQWQPPGGFPPWIPPALQQQIQTAYQSQQGQAPGNSPMSQGAPPWAQSLSGGYNLPGSIAQPSIPFASAQQWGSYMPQEQQAILGAANSMGIDPGSYMQQMYASGPEWGPQSMARYGSY